MAVTLKAASASVVSAYRHRVNAVSAEDRAAAQRDLDRALLDLDRLTDDDHVPPKELIAYLQSESPSCHECGGIYARRWVCRTCGDIV